MLLCARSAPAQQATALTQWGIGTAYQAVEPTRRRAQSLSVLGELARASSFLALRLEWHHTWLSARRVRTPAELRSVARSVVRGSRLGAILRAPQPQRHSPVLYAAVGLDERDTERSEACTSVGCNSLVDGPGQDFTWTGGVGYRWESSSIQWRVALEGTVSGPAFAPDVAGRRGVRLVAGVGRSWRHAR